MRRIRCAIYPRKSTEEGLEQEFNSLDAQAEACKAFVASQRHEGWELIDRAYDDSGISGGHINRPALQRLMQDIDEKQVDQIVVYKIDRLTRSLADFARLVDRLDKAEASFVSVTQSFNTGTSMGRLTLNVLLSFAQFEREVTAERIRDKIAASKKMGLWMGGGVPLGYDAEGRVLKINEDEAKSIRSLYDLYETHRALNVVTREAELAGIRSRRRKTRAGDWRGGNMLSRGHVHYILTSPIYAGRIPHKGKAYEGQHPAIINAKRWDRIQAMLKEHSVNPRGPRQRMTMPSPLTGKLFDETGKRLSPSHANKKGKRYRYYISHDLVGGRKVDAKGRGWRLPAEELEKVVCAALQRHLTSFVARWALELPDPAAHKAMTEALDDQSWMLDAVQSASLDHSRIRIETDADVVASTLGIDRDLIDPSATTFDTPFTLKRRGVEIRFVMDAPSTKLDEALIGNLARAHAWLAQIKAGTAITEISKSDRITSRRVQQTLEFAFLAPERPWNRTRRASPRGSYSPLPHLAACRHREREVAPCVSGDDGLVVWATCGARCIDECETRKIALDRHQKCS